MDIWLILNCAIETTLLSHSFTYDHRILRTRLPVRSALFKQDTGGLVVRWVTTSESPLLYVFCFCVSTTNNSILPEYCFLFASLESSIMATDLLFLGGSRRSRARNIPARDVGSKVAESGVSGLNSLNAGHEARSFVPARNSIDP